MLFYRLAVDVGTKNISNIISISYYIVDLHLYVNLYCGENHYQFDFNSFLWNKYSGVSYYDSTSFGMATEPKLDGDKHLF